MDTLHPLPIGEPEQADFLAIDDLLDFSNDDIHGPFDSCHCSINSSLDPIIITPASEAPKLSSIVTSPRDRKLSQQTPSVFDSGELCIPCDDLAELEWLSNFVEESFSSADQAPMSLICNAGTFVRFSTEDLETRGGSLDYCFQRTSPVSVLENSSTSAAHSKKKQSSLITSCGSDMMMSIIPARTRSKRCRTAVCFWNTRILSEEASARILETSSTTNSTITGAASSDSDILTTYYDHDDDYYDDGDGDGDGEGDDDGIDLHKHQRQLCHPHKRSAGHPFLEVKKSSKHFDRISNKKPKKLKAQADGGLLRKCLHCATQKTPQWRAGPMGPKTLCNACGVRYKSGRLCAEYRPAMSPTFNENVHSNSHRKVLEMRRRRAGELTNSVHEKLESRLGGSSTHDGGNNGHLASRGDV